MKLPRGAEWDGIEPRGGKKRSVTRICLVCAAPATVRAFLAPHVRRLAREFHVTVVCDGQLSPGDDLPAECVCIHVVRPLLLTRDVVAWMHLVRLFRRERFDVVHSFTSKAGLLAMTVAWAGGIRHCYHTFTGQVWATRRGLWRHLLKACDRVIVHCASEVLADSPSQLRFLRAERVVPQTRGEVLGAGSISGVDGARFHPDASVRQAVRAAHGISENTSVVLYVDRLNHDKGLMDLGAALKMLVETGIDARLLLVGPDEDELLPKLRESMGDHAARLNAVGPTSEPERYMMAADVLCLPSYREGFGTVIIEGAACGLPCVATRIYGVTSRSILVPVSTKAAERRKRPLERATVPRSLQQLGAGFSPGVCGWSQQSQRRRGEPGKCGDEAFLKLEATTFIDGCSGRPKPESAERNTKFAPNANPI